MLRFLGARSLVLFVVLLLAMPRAGRAWGVLGHRAVARIAENHLTPAARQQVSQILGWETMPLVSTWADELRNDPQYKETAPWHYLNVATGLDFAAFVKQLNDPSLLAPAAPTNAYTALLQARRDLKDPAKSADEKRVALKFLIHIVGDVHQPLHVGHAEDKGGNSITVNWRSREDSNLHSVWDTAILEYPGFTFTEMSATYDHATPTEIKQWQKDEIPTWLFESYQLCTPIYAAAATNPKFDWHFYPTFGPVAQQQVLKAGIRLAGQLNELFAK
ncbi:S1/P1 nuclease [Hymenobacter agri]